MIEKPFDPNIAPDEPVGWTPGTGWGRGSPRDGASGGGGGLNPDIAMPLLPPKSFEVLSGNPITLVAIDRGERISATALSGAETYHFYWVEDADISTTAGREAAEIRALGNWVGSVDRTYKEDARLPLTVTNSTWRSGFFLVCGMRGGSAERSIFGWSARVVDGILDGTIPEEVSNLALEEFGETVADGVISIVTFTAIAPSPLGSFDRLQFFAGDYPNPGDLTELPAIKYRGPAGGAISGALKMFPGRRKGSGTIGVNNGVNIVFGFGAAAFLTEAAAGWVLEILGTQATILAVTSNGTITLTAGWPGPTLTVDDWYFIANVTLYAVSVSPAGTHRTAVTLSPHASVLLDAELGLPLVPPLLTLTPGGNVVRGAFQQVIGVKSYQVWYSRGSTNDLTTAKLLDTINSDPLKIGSTTQIAFEFSDFTVYDREQGQVFRFYVTTLNRAGARSASYVTATVNVRLDAPNDNGPQVPGQIPGRNLLWNGMLYFNANTTVNVASAVQDTQMGGGAPPAGFGRVDHEESGGSTPAGFINTTECILPAPGAGKYAAIKWAIGAWDAAAGSQRIPKGAYVCFQFKQRTSGGSPNGLVRVDISQRDGGGTHQGWAHVKVRLSSDAIDETGTSFDVNPTDLLFTHQLYWASFHLDPTLTTASIVVRLYYDGGSSAANINVTECMLSIGEALVKWTGELVDSKITYPPPTGGAPVTPGRFPDGDSGGGAGRGIARLEPQ